MYWPFADVVLSDRLADAGVATFNFALDAWDEKPGLPKALVPAQKNLEYLMRKQYAYGYMVFINVNICRNNLEDVRRLTEYAHEHRLATDYHINETPMLEQDDHFTLNHNLAYCYNGARVMKWLWQQAQNGFQGGVRSFAD